MTIRVFLVEDTHHLQNAIRDLLQSLGDFAVVSTARTEAEANLWLLDNPGGWDLAVIDLILEQGTGMGVIAKCRRSNDGGRVMIFSDYATPGIRRHCLGLGAHVTIAKTDVNVFMDYCAALAPAN
ncbi:response regulator [Ramlibacter sp. WS9]|uniref:response regulator n=1 Tax=Ramlibacter sp. WS9 TaxID=1882741 RepID=UPI001143F012|nr:response regulator [Ramlibacter sp. WS9]ROZ64535.1 DNA-binding response regulator [Ramlibacter sp. WS9]